MRIDLQAPPDKVDKPHIACVQPVLQRRLLRDQDLGLGSTLFGRPCLGSVIQLLGLVAVFVDLCYGMLLSQEKADVSYILIQEHLLLGEEILDQSALLDHPLWEGSYYPQHSRQQPLDAVVLEEDVPGPHLG